jgi:hypothetical protein
MEQFCMACERPEPNPKYKCDANRDFICSSCVQIFLNLEKDQIEEAVNKSEAAGNARRAAAIRIFWGLK